jgi:hypothetical protein
MTIMDLRPFSGVRRPRSNPAILKWLAPVSLAVVLAGCNTLYLHNPEREALVDKAKQQLSGVDLLSLTEQQTTILADYATHEDAAVVEYGAQARDQNLLAMLRPDLADPDSGKEYVANNGSLQINHSKVRLHLSDATNDRLGRLICGSSTCQFVLRDVLTFSAPTNPRASEDEEQLVILSVARAKYASALKEADKATEASQVKSCLDLAEGEVTKWVATHPDANVIELLGQGKKVEGYEADYYQTCSRYQNMKEKDDILLRSMLKGGELDVTLRELSDAKAEIRILKAEEAALAAEMDELAKAIKEAQADHIGEAADRIAGLLKNAKEGAKGLGLEKLSDILDALIQGEVGTAAGDAAGTAEDNPDATKYAALTAMSRLLKSSAGAVETFEGKNPIERLNSLLILRAGLQQKIDEERLYRNKLESDLLIIQGKTAAIVAELYQLARTRAILDYVPENSPLWGDEPLLQALSAYTASWNRGRIPQYLAAFKQAQIERTYSVKLYQATAKNYRAVLEPAFAALESYAKGGITPGDLAKVLAVTLFLAKFATL